MIEPSILRKKGSVIFKIVLPFLALFILALPGLALEQELVQSQTGGSGNFQVGYDSNYVYTSTTFTANETYEVSAAEFRIAKIGSPTFNLNVTLYAADGGGAPTGSQLAVSEVTIDSSTLSSSYAWINFSFDEDHRYEVQDGTQYVFVMWQIDGSTSTSNYVKQEFNNNGAAGEYIGNANTLGGISTSPNDQFNFRSYKELSPPSHVTTTLISPKTGGVNNTQDIQIRLNATYQLADPDTISLYTNETGTWAESEMYAAQNGTQNVLHTFSNGKFLFGVRANDTLGNTDFSLNRTITIDTEDPAITTNFQNNSLYYNEQISADFNFTDNIAVHSVNLSINGNTVFSNESINQPTFDYFLNTSSNNYLIGNNNLTVRFADGHTAKRLKDPTQWEPKKGIFNNKIEYDLKGKYERINMQLENKEKSLFDKWETIKKEDRISEVYEPSRPSSTQTFTFKSDQKIHVIPRGLTNKYGETWIVTGDHWKDFALKNEPEARINIKKISDYEAEITITGIKNHPEKLQFDSTGDLNIVTQTYTFYVTDLTETFENPIFGGFDTRYNISANLTNIPITTGSATLEINQTTNYTATLSLLDNNTAKFTQLITYPFFESTGNISHKWYVTLDNTSLETPSIDQEFLDVDVGVCSASNIYPIVNYTYVDEINGTALNATHVYTLKVSDGTHFYNQSGAFSSAETNSLCTNVNPDNATYSFNVWGENTISADDYVTRVISIDSSLPYTFSNNPITNITYYLIPTASSNTVTYTWLTEDLQTVDGTMRIFKCEDDGTKSLVESIPIISGEGIANIELLTQAYSYDITFGGVLYTDTDSYTRCHVEGSTSITLYVDTRETQQTQQLQGLSSIQCSLTKSATNNTVVMSWAPNPQDSSYVSGCILAERLMVTGEVPVYNNCSVEAEGYNRTVTIPTNGNDYVVNAYLKQGDNSLFCSDTVEYRPSRNSTELFGFTSALLSAIFLILSLVLIYGTDGEGTLIAASIGIIASFFLGIINLSWPVVFTYTAFLLFVAAVGRYSRK